MSLRLEWFEEAEADLLQIPDWRVAAAVDAAVNRLAREAIGFVLRLPSQDEGTEFRLLIPGMRTYVRVRRSASTLYVERVIYRP